MLLIILFLIAGGLFLGKIEAENKNKVNVKEVVIFKNGQKIFSDVAVAKIFDIPVDVHDKLQLYHVTDTTQAMHGADRGFDVLQPLNGEQQSGLPDTPPTKMVPGYV